MIASYLHERNQEFSDPRLSTRTALLVVVCLAQFMVILDISIVNVALPSIRDGLGFSTTGLQWVVNAYTLTFAGLLMLGGRCGGPARPPPRVPGRHRDVRSELAGLRAGRPRAGC